MNCILKNLFGKPNEGLHSYRLNDVAIVDYVLTIILAIFISKRISAPLVLTTVILFILGEIFHYLFCVETSTIRFFT